MLRHYSLVIRGNFDCSKNQLTNLENSPTTVKGTFDCSENPILSLKGSPAKVQDNFVCSDTLIKNFEGLSGSINSWLLAYRVDLDNFVGLHTKIGHFACGRKDRVKFKGLEKYYATDTVFTVESDILPIIIEKTFMDKSLAKLGAPSSKIKFKV